MKRFDVAKTRMSGSESDYHLTKLKDRQTPMIVLVNGFACTRFVSKFLRLLFRTILRSVKLVLCSISTLNIRIPTTVHLTPKDKDWMEMYGELEEIVDTAVLPDKSPCRCRDSTI